MTFLYSAACGTSAMLAKLTKVSVNSARPMRALKSFTPLDSCQNREPKIRPITAACTRPGRMNALLRRRISS